MVLRPVVGKARALLAAVIIAGFVANAGWMALRDRSEARREAQRRALNFAELTKGPIVTAYEAFYTAGFYKFRELIKDRMRLNPYVERIQMADLTGRIVFDTDKFDAPSGAGPVTASLTVTDPPRLRAIQALDITVLPADRSRSRLEIVVPHLEDWGRHPYSLVYDVRIDGSRETGLALPLIERLVPALAFAALTVAAVLALLRRMA